MGLIIRKGYANVYLLNEDISEYPTGKKEKIIDDALKKKYLEKSADKVLNEYDFYQLGIKAGKIDAPIKWLYYEKPAIINSLMYTLKMCVRNEGDKYYIHNIYSLLKENN